MSNWAFAWTKPPPSAEALALAAAIKERKRLKSLGRIAKLKAKQRGDLRRMPLQGYEALRFIWGPVL